MRHLCIVNTYYQLIVCIQLKNTLFIDDSVTLLITDHSKNAYNVADRLQSFGLFDEVHYIETKDIDRGIGRLTKIRDCIQIAYEKSNRYDYLYRDIRNKHYDDILFNNTGYLFIDACYSYFCKYNTKLTMSLFEESVLSYNVNLDVLSRRKMIDNIRRIRKGKRFEEVLDRYYCFYPESYKGKLNVKKIPLIQDKSDTAMVLKALFDVKMNYHEKYIFFASVYDFEGGDAVGEFELVDYLASIVGKENLLIKQHPRDGRTIYIDNGYMVDKNSDIPWEAIQISGNFSKNIFLTLNSSAVLSGSAMAENPVKTYFLFNLCDVSKNPKCSMIVENIKNILCDENMAGIFREVYIANGIEDFI